MHERECPDGHVVTDEEAAFCPTCGSPMVAAREGDVVPLVGEDPAVEAAGVADQIPGPGSAASSRSRVAIAAAAGLLVILVLAVAFTFSRHGRSSTADAVSSSDTVPTTAAPNPCEVRIHTYMQDRDNGDTYQQAAADAGGIENPDVRQAVAFYMEFQTWATLHGTEAAGNRLYQDTLTYCTRDSTTPVTSFDPWNS